MATKSSGITAVVLVLVGVVAVSGVMLAVAMLGQHGCGQDAALPTGPVNAAARKEIPAKLLPIFQQVGSQQQIYWQVLAGVSKEECTFGTDSDASCTIRWHGTGLGPANSAGAAGLMQIGIGGAAGNEWGSYGTDGDHNGHKDPHDPFDGIPGAAKVLRDEKGMPPAPAPLAKIREAVRAYNGTGPTAEAYADRVMADAASYGLKDGAQPQGVSETDAVAAITSDASAGGGGCGGDEGAGLGPANLKQTITLDQPREYETVPAWAMASGRPPEPCDKRIVADVLWVLRTYHLRITACREAGHHTHGAGLATDLVPEPGSSWPSTAQQVAEDMGWTAGCGANGLAKHAGGQCDLVPAIRGIFYNGYPGHGDPQHCSGGCGAHIHISWEGSTYAAPDLVSPAATVKVFPVPSTDGTEHAVTP
jgi:hypothetical protein